MPKLGLNVDHVATLRQARGELEPDPILAAKISQQAGAHSIVAHLREDRRHIQDSDVQKLKKTVLRLNLEMSLNKDILLKAIKIKPHQATLVPEKRQELTTEGGLDVVKNFLKIQHAVKSLSREGIVVSLFIDPEKKQILASKRTGASTVEIHTGKYANAKTNRSQKQQLDKICKAVFLAKSLGLTVHAGHGLKYHNTKPIADIPGIEELNIGHSIISRAVFSGLHCAVKEMVQIAKGKK